MYVSLCNMNWTKLIHIKGPACIRQQRPISDQLQSKWLPWCHGFSINQSKKSHREKSYRTIVKLAIWLISHKCFQSLHLVFYFTIVCDFSRRACLDWPIIHAASQPDQVQALFGASYSCKCISVLLSQTKSGTPRLAMIMNAMVTILPTYLGGISRANVALDSIFL